MSASSTTSSLLATAGSARPAHAARIQSVDALRGLVMIIMALDHARDFFHTSAALFQPDDLTRTSTALFLTRWITHYCAPVFMFTAGIGAFCRLSSGRTKGRLSRFLATRGLWLVCLDLTVVHYALAFSFTSSPFVINVLWGLGWAMVALALLVYLPMRMLTALSLAVIALHNLLDRVALWPGLHQLSVLQAGQMTVVISYTLIPWFAVMSAGFCFGRVTALPPEPRRRWMFRIGVTGTLAFLVLRSINLYGDPGPWSRGFGGMTALSFLRVNKYPPSLDFLLMTLGPAILLLAWFDRLRFSEANPLTVFGRVPLFYFVLHLFILHSLALRWSTPNLGVVYLWWIGAVVGLYPLCLWFARFRATHKNWWLSYL